ncbi:HCL248Cp [Eremothecium sinecaudum]|uniref:HCL248Cp n=1 Tax=Eremothecium sinecaudum TaxID=45286 RepID=A0A109UYP5_9SACH|nr:HCL248Cp [Eremothecium sinecaudum]AMD19903.1 HCL248Cp [Eremothecium sinecaudum]
MPFEFPPSDVQPLVQEIAEILISRNETIAVSEAACGGLMSSFLVSVPGALRWFHGGTLVYSLNSRLKLSGWSEEDIKSYTGPSPKVALRSARNLRFELGATYALSETGFASRSKDLTNDYGEQDVGTVYIGLTGPNGDQVITFHTGIEERCENMRIFATKGLEFLLKVLKEAENSTTDNESDE